MASSLPDDDEDEGGGGGGGGSIIAGINVTPLVDITLVLLIIFMVTARFIVGRAIPVKTPRAVSGEHVPTTLGLTIDAEGLLYFNGQSLEQQELTDRVRQAVLANPEIQAVITADVTVQHGEVVSLIDAVKQAGVRSFALGVEEKPAKD
ncbi:MAG: biopolymer transporter ExbD [Pseudomonadota bacterium]